MEMQQIVTKLTGRVHLIPFPSNTDANPDCSVGRRRCSKVGIMLRSDVTSKLSLVQEQIGKMGTGSESSLQ